MADETRLIWARAKKQGYISKGIASAIKKGKNTLLNTVEDGIDDALTNQVEAIEKIDGYVNKWKKYFEEGNFTNMEYQYNKIQEYMEKVVPIEDTIKKARTIENLHELIKNNGKYYRVYVWWNKDWK